MGLAHDAPPDAEAEAPRSKNPTNLSATRAPAGPMSAFKSGNCASGRGRFRFPFAIASASLLVVVGASADGGLGSKSRAFSTYNDARAAARPPSVDARAWMRASDSPQQRAAALLAEMNVTDKLALLHQDNMVNYSGVVVGNPRLQIPALNMNNGRQGFATAQGAGGGASSSPWSTAFPCQLAVSATFDAELVREFGRALGQEFFVKGANVVLAPMLILARVPQGGRNFESVGEDPAWAYDFARAHISGVQSVPGVMANADDFVLNNQETNRYGGNSVCDERTRWELYYRAYQGAVDAEVASLM